MLPDRAPIWAIESAAAALNAARSAPPRANTIAVSQMVMGNWGPHYRGACAGDVGALGSSRATLPRGLTRFSSSTARKE
jgi:hypothetical protein